MDARSRLERQKARLRERLQDSSARAAAGRGEGVGGVHDFSTSSASPVHLGEMMNVASTLCGEWRLL